MSTTTTLVRRRNPTAMVAGTLDLIIGLTVLAGYASQTAVLITFLPGSAPMRSTTAVAIALCGAAILLLAGGLFRTAAACGVLCGLIGVFSLGEVIAGVRVPALDMGLGWVYDQTGATSPHGGVLIGLLLVLAAVALVLMSGVVRIASRLAVVGIAGSILVSFGLVAAISYGAGVSAAFTGGAFTRLAVHTAFAVALIGAALIRFAWRDSLATGIGTPAWLPLLVAAGTLTASFSLYAAMEADQRSDFAHRVTFQAEGLRQYLNSELDTRIQPLIRLARRRAAAPDAKKEEWDADTQMILMRGGYQAIEWIDAEGRLVWAAPPGAGDATADGNAGFEYRRREAFEQARTRRSLAMTRPIDLVTGGRGMLVVVPVFARDELLGYVAGVCRYELLFDNLLSANPAPEYAIAVYDGVERLFARGFAGGGAGLRRASSLTVGKARWTLDIGPAQALVLQADSPAGGALLVGGGLLAVLFGLLVRLAQIARVHPSFEQTAVPVAPGSAVPSADAARVPVVCYGREGVPLTWNDAARTLLVNAPPPIAPYPDGSRIVQTTLLRANATPDGLDPLRPLLDSCALPALIFDVEGGFVAANAACGKTLGWPDTLWRGRKIAPAPPASRGPLEVQSVLIMQGQFAVPASASAATATL